MLQKSRLAEGLPVPSASNAMLAARANGRRIEVADPWIAATALLYSAELVTHNPKDYLGIPNLKVLTRPDNRPML
jgi:predicted nucleic acid-binding protein